MLTADKIRQALARLGELAVAEGFVVDLAIYGGSAIALAWGFRDQTRDVDVAVRSHVPFLRKAARQVAQELDLEEDWLNDGVKGFLAANERLDLKAQYPSAEQPGLRVYLPTAEYLLAMKCMAMRLEGGEASADVGDIKALVKICGLRTADEVLDLVASFYPRKLIPQKTLYGIEEIMENRE